MVNGVDAPLDVRRDRERHRGEVCLELRHRRCADDIRRDEGPRRDEGDRKLRRIGADILRQRQIGGDRLFDFRLLIALRAPEKRGARAGRRAPP